METRDATPCPPILVRMGQYHNKESAVYKDSSTEMGKPRLNCNLSMEPDALRLICPLVVLLSEVSLSLYWCPGV